MLSCIIITDCGNIFTQLHKFNLHMRLIFMLNMAKYKNIKSFSVERNYLQIVNLKLALIAVYADFIHRHNLAGKFARKWK